MKPGEFHPLDAVIKAVRPAVDDPWTTATPGFVHTFTSCHPLRDAQSKPCPAGSVLAVIAQGYEAIHSVHRTY